MQKRKMRATPSYSNLLNAVTQFLVAGRLPNEYEAWMKAANDVLKNNKAAAFNEFMAFSGPFYGENALYSTPGKKWRFSSYDFQMVSVDSIQRCIPLCHHQLRSRRYLRFQRHLLSARKPLHWTGRKGQLDEGRPGFQ
jgi:hypothetical protein